MARDEGGESDVEGAGDGVRDGGKGICDGVNLVGNDDGIGSMAVTGGTSEEDMVDFAFPLDLGAALDLGLGF